MPTERRKILLTKLRKVISNISPPEIICTLVIRTYTAAKNLLKSARKDAEKEKKVVDQAMKKAQERFTADIKASEKASEKKVAMISKERDAAMNATLKERNLHADKASKEKAEKGNHLLKFSTT
jgi:sugar-specific transcriptional regulator TrmB